MLTKIRRITLISPTRTRLLLSELTLVRSLLFFFFFLVLYKGDFNSLHRSIWILFLGARIYLALGTLSQVDIKRVYIDIYEEYSE